MDITDTLTPKSDQLNAEDLLTGPRIFTIEKVTKGSVEQPVEIHLKGLPGRPFKPSKTVRRILVSAWGAEASAYTGRRMMLYRDPAVRFGGMDVGGIRVSALSHISQRLTIALTVSKGRRAPYVVEPLPDEPKATALAAITDDAAIDFGREIAESTTLDELNAIGQAMKGCDLGSHKKQLQTAWSERSAAIKAAGAQDEQLPTNTTDEEN